MPRALSLLRESLHYRKNAFRSGLAAAGFTVVESLNDPKPDDLLVIWNRYGHYDADAKRFEAAGARVAVVENGYLGKHWRDGEWFSMSLSHHAGAGQWHVGSDDRWDSLNVALADWRSGGTETVIFAQRGIGEPKVASPDRWAQNTQLRVGGRIRDHPRKGDASVPLAEDLWNAKQVVTWHSSAALTALMLGIPCFYAFPKWIGAPAGKSISEWGSEPLRDDELRLFMFRRLMWAMWDLKEIEHGDAFNTLMQVQGCAS